MGGKRELHILIQLPSDDRLSAAFMLDLLTPFCIYIFKYTSSCVDQEEKNPTKVVLHLELIALWTHKRGFFYH